MNDFDKNWRRKQELRMRPIADAKYKGIFGENISIKRFEMDDNFILDKKYAIDVEIKLENGQILLGQEKFLSHKYAGFKSITIEYYQNPKTGEEGDWFKISAQIYFVGYCTRDFEDFKPWVLINWPKIVCYTKDGIIKWQENKNREDGARANFKYTSMDNLPDDCIIAKCLEVT